MPPALPPKVSENCLLDLLPPEEYRRLAPLLEPVSLVARQQLYRANDPLTHVYFPLSGVISSVTRMEDSREVEVATVGREGMVGILAALGVDAVPYEVLTQVAGEALRLAVGPFREALADQPRFADLIRRYAAVLLRQADQVLACNALHAVPERMGRWLLMAHDRVGEDEFALTQEFLAQMLGVSRQTVSAVAGTLQEGGLLTYRRGVVHVRDRGGLEEASCECYRAMKDYYDRTLRVCE